MNAGFEAKGELVLPKNVDLSGSLWVQAAVDVYEGGKFERGPGKLGLINVGGKKVRSFVGPAQSFMRNWGISLIRSFFYTPSDTEEQYNDDSGVARNVAMYEGLGGSNQGLVASVGDFKFGDSNAAVTALQTNLQGIILGPTGPLISTVLQEDTVARVFKVEGTILNSGAAFNIREVGLFARLRDGAVAGQNYRSMFMRDIVSPLVPVANGQTALGRYTFTAAI